MEELQDAIEDAQYVNAIATQEEGPRPVLPWEFPTDEQLAVWEASIRRDAAAAAAQSAAPTSSGGDKETTEKAESAATTGSANTTSSLKAAGTSSQPPEPFGLEWMLQSALGFFMFSTFLKTKCDDWTRINFCEDMARVKRLRGRARLEKTRSIMTTYLKKPPVPGNETETDDEGTALTQTEIDELDLERDVPDLRMTKEQFESLYRHNMDYPACTETCVGLKGPVLQDIRNKMQTIDDQQGMKKMMSMPAKGFAQANAAAGEQRDDTTTTNGGAGHDNTSSDGKPKNRGSSTPSSEVSIDPGVPPPPMPPSSSRLKGDRMQSKSCDFDGASQLDVSTHSQGAQPTAAKAGTPSSADKGASMRRGNNTEYSDQVFHNGIFNKAEAVVMESLRRQYWDKFVESPEYRKVKNFLWYKDKIVTPEDFFVMRVLGRGGFGLVTACKKGTSGKLYAMKVMNKRRIKMKKSEQLAVAERQALAAVESPFVVNLKYSFHSKDDVFLILDLMTGGDLGFHLQQKGRFPKRECQYYAARIMLGLQAIHDQQYVYRDLKPENCLLDEDGRVKITDLGLATKITPTLHGAAGTRGYWAPEMLRRDKKGKRIPYGHTVDWFSFGCCLAEFISGTNPFRSETALRFGESEGGKATKEKAIDYATLEMEPELKKERFEPDAADLCRRLLDKNEKTRLGYNGCEEIMAHPWFKNVNWESIISDRKRPPFIPAKDVNAASQSEIGNFAEDKAYQETVITDVDEEVYNDWDWTNPRAFAAEVIEFLIYERETGEPLLPIAQNASCCCVIL